jgi:hypothetical protein
MQPILVFLEDKRLNKNSEDPGQAAFIKPDVEFRLSEIR